MWVFSTERRNKHNSHIKKAKKQIKKTDMICRLFFSKASQPDTRFEMQWSVCPCFKRRGMSLCLYSYLPVFRFRLSRWIFLLRGDLNLLQKRWPFQMTVWVWHKPQMMKRGKAWPFLVLCQALPMAHTGAYWDWGHKMVKYPKPTNGIRKK